GIAVRFEDLQNNVREFKCVETIFAGNSFSKKINTGECYKIMTGAAVPPTADVVIRVEETLAKNGIIEFSGADFKHHQNIAQQGQDLKRNELALKEGSFINAAIIGMLASFGKAKVFVQKLPLINIITTGNEISELNDEILPTHIYNSNKYVLKSLLKQNGIPVQNCVHIPDDLETLKSTAKNYLATDILILTGGVSAGEADFIPETLNSLGVKELFHKVAIKPGKPIWCGTLGQTMVFALPGNPFSCLVTFKLFVEFYIKTCLGLNVSEMDEIPINFDRIKKSNLDEFFPVNFKNGLLNKIDINGSGDVRLGFASNALAMQQAPMKEIKRGIPISYLPL
ncbi:MAG: molybdopterin molybdotransferase MoeA, partial [Pelobium sp.]